MRLFDQDGVISSPLEKPMTKTLFHERAEMLSNTEYLGFKVITQFSVPSGYRIVVENRMGHRLQADGEHPVEILERLVEMIDAYKD